MATTSGSVRNGRASCASNGLTLDSISMFASTRYFRLRTRRGCPPPSSKRNDSKKSAAAARE